MISLSLTIYLLTSSAGLILYYMSLKINITMTQDDQTKYVVVDDTVLPERALKSFDTEEQATQFINIFTRKDKRLGP